METVHAIILAAGDSRRYGSPKQLVSWKGRTLLENAVSQARSVCHERVTVVLGAEAGAVEPVLSGSGARLVMNREWREGLASSIRSGVRALSPDVDAALFLLCDQPLITGARLTMLVERWQHTPDSIIASYYNGTPGVPAVFPRSLFAELLELEGDRGAKQVMHAHRHRLQSVPVPQAGFDIDTPGDLQILLSEHDSTGVHYDHAHH